MASLIMNMRYPAIRWAVGGWSFFIAENALLSENRTWLIHELGDDRYHLCYGTLSSIATVSIGYAFYSIRKMKLPTSMTLWNKRPPMTAALGGWLSLSIGFIMASQAIPKLQIPVAVANSSLQVRCPFDFTDSKGEGNSLHGLERITRHPGLWSFGFIGLGQACLSATLPLQLWWCGPAAVAWLGGAHTDSRFQRGLGGTLTPHYEARTSNIPFWALMSGKQGSGSWQALGQEIKPLNAIVAVAASSLWVVRKVVR